MCATETNLYLFNIGDKVKGKTVRLSLGDTVDGQPS